MTSLPIENVQAYPRPAVLEPVAEPLSIYLDDACIAHTTRGYRVLETHHAPTYYVPPEDVTAPLHPVAGTTFCEWKGVARYFDVEGERHVARRAAWCYERPSGAFAPIAGYLAFYAASMQRCLVGDIEVIPQPGDFYGGWVTPNLRGQVKGAPGTRHW
ncbi:uncharacterized protein (DUF427 family) [Halomonas fontilapidosi]|uniref:Uncharacterized protein (DUF427 family) n=1 Tax=Halomonas fontilapidosi TaxID=616675 RepID=A0A7W5DJT9_9GAMM|nr:DUF427 domain-containing protein [Halomonas fontilapidosi]MBB3184240.1 uncharacterized protein (DUF427 family) [Halomonas fontilapidosi]